jgi:anti-sigma B factor antagonist
MSASPRSRRLNVETIGDVTVAHLLERRIIDEANVRALGEELFKLAEGQRRKVVLDFKDVEYLSSAALSKLVELNSKLCRRDGNLVLCGIRSDIFEVFRITRLDRLFIICPNVDEAIHEA